MIAPAPVTERDAGSTGRRLPTVSMPDAAALVPWGILFLLVVVDAILQPSTLTLSNVGAVVFGALPLVFAAAGQTLVVLAGGVDLSIAGVLSLTSALLATQADATTLPLWLFLCSCVGCAVGLGNAICIIWLRMQPFIVTLGTWSIVGGCALLVLPSQGGTVPSALSDVGILIFGGIPLSIIILAVVVLTWLWARRTGPIRRIYAYGSDRQSSTLLGVRPARTLLLTYALAGICAALGGIFYTSQVASGDPIGGNTYILTSITAVVIGGARLSGGRGSLLGTIAGAFVTVYIADVVFGFGLSSFWTPLIQGLLLISAVLVSAASSYLSKRRIR